MRLSKKFMRTLTLCLALALVVCGVTVMPASAGKAGGYVVDADMLSTETLSQAEWRFDDTGVTLKDGALVFDEFYDVENPVLSRTAVYSSEEIEEALEIRFVISVDEIKGDKQFGLGFGIPRLNRDITEEGAAFLYAQATEKGIGFGLSTVKDGEVVDLKELTHYGSKAKDVAVTVQVTNKGAVTVLLGSSFFYAGEEGEVMPDGYVGFSSSGGWTDEENYVKATVKNFVAYNEYYAKPEAPLQILADFSNSEFNVNEWTMSASNISGGSGIVCKDGILRFDGAGQNAAIGAQFKYSNFELQLDFFDMKNTLTAHSNGTPIPPSQWFQISWGTDAASAYAAASYYGAEYRLIFETGLDLDPNSPTYLQRPANSSLSVHFYDPNGWKGATPIPAKYAFNNPSFDPETVVQMRLVNVDGNAILYMKLDTETEWTEIWRHAYANGVMPLGYVVLRGEGNQFAGTRNQYYHGGWYSLDNIMIKNYDKNPSLVAVTFESNRIPPVPDYDYKSPFVDTYLISHTGGKP